MKKKESDLYTSEDFDKAIKILKYFSNRKAKSIKKFKEALEKQEEQYNKLPRKKGIKYTLCQHLREHTQDVEQYTLWVGDNMRIVLCPICAKAHIGHLLSQVFVHIRRNDPEIREILERGEDALERYKFFNETEKNQTFFAKLLKKSAWAKQIFPFLFDE